MRYVQLSQMSCLFTPDYGYLLTSSNLGILGKFTLNCCILNISSVMCTVLWEEDTDTGPYGVGDRSTARHQIYQSALQNVLRFTVYPAFFWSVFLYLFFVFIFLSIALFLYNLSLSLLLSLSVSLSFLALTWISCIFPNIVRCLAAVLLEEF